jgi:predicted nucleic acid-binding protein
MQVQARPKSPHMLVDDVSPTGNLVSDAHIVALMRDNGVRTILTRDRDYRKFTGITVRDPFKH